MTQPKSFAYIQHTQIPGPSAHSVYVLNSVIAASKLGYQSYLISPKSAEKKSLRFYYKLKTTPFKQISISSVPTLRFLPSRILNPIRSCITLFFALRSWFISKKLNLSIVQTANPELIIVFKLLSKFYRPLIIYDAHVPLANWLTSPLLSQIDLFLTTTQNISQQISKSGIPPSKIITLPMGYEPNDFQSSSKSTSIRNRYFKPSDFVIGYIGRFLSLDIEKGLFLLLDCIAQINDKSVKAFIIGGPPFQLRKYQQHASKLGIQDRVVFHKQVPLSQVASYIYTFDLAWMVYPRHPHFENNMSPMKMIEYAAAGIVTLASDFPSITNYPLSQNFYLANPDKPSAIIQSIQQIKSNHPAAQSKALIAQKQVKQYTWKNRQQLIFSQLLNT